MSILFDPKVFNYVIIALYGIASIRWLIDKDYLQAIYFFTAMVLTITVGLMRGN